MSATDYTPEFFASTRSDSHRSALTVLPPVLATVAPATAVDIGCGVGTWTSVLLDHGVDALGVDGDYVPSAALQIPADRFRARDLTRPAWDIAGRYDLAVCLEVAEHLPEAAADDVVRNLTELAPVVLFSAAIPWQGGQHHVNEQWQSWWAARFAARGFAAYDVVRPAAWLDPGVEWWYAQNTLLYVGEERARALTLPAPADPAGLDAVHPRLWTKQNREFAIERAVRARLAAARQRLQRVTARRR